MLQFRYHVIQLGRLKWRDFLRRKNPVAAALMAKMGMKPKERPRVKLECLRLLATLKLNRQKMRLISGFIDTYLRLTAQEELIFTKEADTLLERSEKGKVMEIVTSWMEKGLKQGRQEGQLQIIMKQLKRRWGGISKTIEPRAQDLPSEQLERLAEALLDFHSPDDLEGWLKEHA